jgi:hypothetical protein
MSYTIREHLVLYCHAPCLMNTWTTETYWAQQKKVLHSVTLFLFLV